MVQIYSPHIKNVTALPCEIENAFFTQYRCTVYVLSGQKLRPFSQGSVVTFLGEVDKFVVAYTKFIQNYVYKKLYYRDKCLTVLTT